MWLLVIAQKNGYKFHSAHGAISQAEAWKACKEHDGEDCAIVHLAWSDAQDLVDSIERLRKNEVAQSNND